MGQLLFGTRQIPEAILDGLLDGLFCGGWGQGCHLSNVLYRMNFICSDVYRIYLDRSANQNAK